MNERNEPLGPLAAGMQSSVSAKLGDIWWAFMLGGVFAGVLGIFASGSLRVCCSRRSADILPRSAKRIRCKTSLPRDFPLSNSCSCLMDVQIKT